MFFFFSMLFFFQFNVDTRHWCHFFMKLIHICKRVYACKVDVDIWICQCRCHSFQMNFPMLQCSITFGASIKSLSILIKIHNTYACYTRIENTYIPKHKIELTTSLFPIAFPYSWVRIAKKEKYIVLCTTNTTTTNVQYNGKKSFSL